MKKRPLLLLALFSAVATLIYASLKHPTIPPFNHQSNSTSHNLVQSEPATLPSAAPSQTATAAQVSATPDDLAKLHVLDEILASKNDNDPRMDQVLRHLSPASKALMRERYGKTAPEKRNQRGTIVFLIGRELNSADDVAFLHSVLSEPPCLSLADCSREERSPPSDHHLDGMNETTLAYPQLMALHQIQSALGGSSNGGPLSPALLAELDAASRSPVRTVASKAEQILREYRAAHP